MILATFFDFKPFDSMPAVYFLSLIFSRFRSSHLLNFHDFLCWLHRSQTTNHNLLPFTYLVLFSLISNPYFLAFISSSYCGLDLDIKTMSSSSVNTWCLWPQIKPRFRKNLVLVAQISHNEHLLKIYNIPLYLTYIDF